MRAIAAYLVFFFHFNPFVWGGHLPSTKAAEVAGAVVGEWNMGVSIFFVLSGFLIATRYVDRIERSVGWAKRYMLNRFARIYPLFFLLTIAVFLLVKVCHIQSWYTTMQYNTLTGHTTPGLDKVLAVATNLTLTRAFFRSFYMLGVPTAWSLTVEECFYISAPFLLLVLRRRPRLLPVLLGAVLATGCLLTLVATQLHSYGRFMQPLSFMLSYTYFGRATEFFVGIGLALWLKKRGNAPAPAGTTLAGFVLLALGVAAMVVFDWHYVPTHDWPFTPGAILVNNMVLPLSVAVLFHGLVNERTWLQRLLSTKLFDLLGKSSYAFYLVHLGVFSDLLLGLVGRNVLVYFIVFNVAAILLYSLVEHPLHTIILKRFGASKELPATFAA
ncbi:MAG: acyltransferase family protein [Janthinobacterium lividum]